jgi:hypothetical protein
MADHADLPVFHDESAYFISRILLTISTIIAIFSK